MSLLLNLLFEPDSYSNEYLLAKFGVDTKEILRTSPLKFAHLAEKSGKGSISNLSTQVRPGPLAPRGHAGGGGEAPAGLRGGGALSRARSAPARGAEGVGDRRVALRGGGSAARHRVRPRCAEPRSSPSGHAASQFLMRSAISRN